MLVIKNVTKKFGLKTVLNNVSLTVKKGEIAVLLGASGVGKSTLLRVINNLETMDQGTIMVDGKTVDLATINQHHIAGMVFQQFNLFDHMTAERNITLALEKTLGKTPAEAKKIAAQLLKHYGLEGKAQAYPSELSGGQKQRLALARMLALKPQIICLDEPTSALDPLLTASVAKTIQDLASQGYMVLIATHDTTLLEKLNCTIYLMSYGSIVATAPSQDFYAHPEKYPQISQFVTGVAEIIE